MALELAHDAYGAAGRPLVILHGLLGSARNWAAPAKQLGEHFRVYVLDLRNHGRSPWAASMRFDEMAADVAAFIQRHALRDAALIGHSLGGKVAMRLALTRPELIARLAVVDVAPVAYEHGFAAYVEAMQAVGLAGLGRRADADAALKAAIPEPGIRSFLLQNLVQGDHGLAWRVNLAALADGMDRLMGFPLEPAAPYRGPTLFLAGGRSDYVRPEHRALIGRLFPSAELATIEGAGHWVHAERPAEFLGALRAFLERA
jgi:pimeloyl-ACP methyl ester carboxylesterase